MVLNPELPHYQELGDLLRSNYEDVFFMEDAIFLERNSRDFVTRIKRIDENASLVTQYLFNQSKVPDSVIKRIWYPKWETSELYDECRVRAGPRRQAGGHGGLFSVTFHTTAASQAFFDALECSKGPSLGTNFTLACPYTILAHYTELEWAREWGVDSALVRISIGLEKAEALLGMFQAALAAAQRTASSDKSY
jgi:cystathionine gamma-synthase